MTFAIINAIIQFDICFLCFLICRETEYRILPVVLALVASILSITGFLTV